MKQKTKTADKLAGYSAMALAFVAMHNESTGQTVYTDINPDSVLTTSGFMETMDLDLDADAFPDFTLHASYFTSLSAGYGGFTYFHIGIQGLGLDQVASYIATSVIYTSTPFYANSGTYTASQSMAKGFAPGNPILPISNFNSNVYMFYHDCTTFYWSTGTYCWNAGLAINDTSIIGFRLNNGGQNYYGWMRVYLDNSTTYYYTYPTTVKVLDYAINALPETPVIAGVVPTILVPEIVATSVFATSVKIKWEELPYVRRYELDYRIPGSDWTKVKVKGKHNSVILTGLECPAEYEVMLRAFYFDGAVSEFSEIEVFSTTDCKLNGQATMPDEATIFANGNTLTVQMHSAVTPDTKLYVLNQVGQQVFVADVTEQYNTYQLDLPTGVYVVNLLGDDVSVAKTVSISGH